MSTQQVSVKQQPHPAEPAVLKETLSLPWMLQSLLRGSPTSTEFEFHWKSYSVWPEFLFVEKSSCHHLLTECHHISWVIQAPVLVCPEFPCAAASRLHLVHQESTAMLRRQTWGAGNVSPPSQNRNTSLSEHMNTSHSQAAPLSPLPSLPQPPLLNPSTNATHCVLDFTVKNSAVFSGRC